MPHASVSVELLCIVTWQLRWPIGPVLSSHAVESVWLECRHVECSSKRPLSTLQASASPQGVRGVYICYWTVRRTSKRSDILHETSLASTLSSDADELPLNSRGNGQRATGSATPQQYL
ncbi:hypothetical protein M430DRAFT_212582 [Amorphotheca resinae ATCC 22711]|uniref:Uncharacterized protein n=1 Tax=Amorphotheca resinae ATCC 22711 TaxID=857342 RepID=A0A2T3B833_AMORE|nr:hypothetical protein M430DRAFT_212582 [Amorphotheca resinae ATCC 22711]PSS23046.1 hypothetical protein M430DRAFT_212582 [Amorphotheca resinae ATCC 22711]